MSAWPQLTVDVVQNAMPTDLGTLYRSWVDANPGKVNRLSELVAEVRRSFRKAVEANPANRLDDEPDTVPSTGFTHAINLVIFQLGMEMGAQFAPEVYGLNIQANIWLRMVQDGSIPVDTMAGDGAPSYRAPERMRWLC